MTYTTVYLPILEQGVKVGELTVTVRANCDQAFKHGLACEVSFEDETGKSHAYNDHMAALRIEQIRRDQPDVWREIREAAEADFIEGCEPASYSSHYVEDFWPTTEQPR